MKNNTSFNVLASFAMTGKDKRFNDVVMSLSEQHVINLMIDSGAFTKHNAKGNFGHITLDNYCEYLNKYGENSEKYVMLDVVGNADQSRINYEYMIARGLKPMFVATMFDRDFDYMRNTLDVTPDICVAGGVTTKGLWMTKRFQDVFRNTDKRAKIHGLGYVMLPNIFRLPLASIDSSSWKSGCRYGNGMVWLGNGRKLTYHYDDYLRHGKKMSKELCTALDKVGITPRMFYDTACHKNRGGNNNIEQFLTLQYVTELQMFCKQNKRDLFLACCQAGDVLQLQYIRDNYRTLKYEDFLKL